MNCDVLVVGAGPGGTAVAYTLAKQGHSIIIVDKKPEHQIGNKVCGDGISPEYYNELANKIGYPVPDAQYQHDCDEIVILASDGATFTIPSYSGTIDRHHYGQKIIQQLKEFDNVHLLTDTRIMTMLVKDEFVTGAIVIQHTDKITVTAKITVDASGTYSVVRKKIPKDVKTKFERTTSKETRFVAYREILQLREPHDFQSQLVISYQPELEPLGAAYYWIFSRDEKMVNVGLGYLITEENRGKDIQEINRTITERHFPTATILSSRGDQIPARLPLESCVHHGLVLVGDAAALANPLNGEGHGPALLSGYHAGLVVDEALKKNDWSEAGLWSFNHYIWHNFGMLNAWGIAVIKIMKKTGAEFIDTIAHNRIITQDEVYTIVNKPEETISPILLLLRGWRSPRLLLQMIKIKIHADKIRNLSMKYPQTPEDDFDKWSIKMNKLGTYN